MKKKICKMLTSYRDLIVSVKCKKKERERRKATNINNDGDV